MAKKAGKPTNKGLRKATEQDVADAVGLFLMAFGQGVNPLHVHRGTVQLLRESFTTSVKVAFQEEQWDADWKRDAATVLGWMAAVGRLASQLALSQGRTIIAAKDFAKALAAVKNEHHEDTDPTSPPFKGISLGKYCL
jgi:hypothetical protein